MIIIEWKCNILLYYHHYLFILLEFQLFIGKVHLDWSQTLAMRMVLSSGTANGLTILSFAIELLELTKANNLTIALEDTTGRCKSSRDLFKPTLVVVFCKGGLMALKSVITSPTLKISIGFNTTDVEESGRDGGKWPSAAAKNINFITPPVLVLTSPADNILATLYDGTGKRVTKGNLFGLVLDGCGDLGDTAGVTLDFLVSIKVVVFFLGSSQPCHSQRGSNEDFPAWWWHSISRSLSSNHHIRVP